MQNMQQNVKGNEIDRVRTLRTKIASTDTHIAVIYGS